MPTNDLDWIKFMEDYFDCSGVCDNPNYYAYSNVNNGPTDKSCKDAFVDFLTKFCDLGVAITGGIAGWLLLTIITACCLCCAAKKDPDNSGAGYYDI